MLCGCSVRTCKPPSRPVTAPITPPITSPVTTAATIRKSATAPTIRRATVLWFTCVLLRRFLVSPFGTSWMLAPLTLFGALPQATQDGDPRHHSHDEHQQHYHTDRQQHHERRPSRRRRMHLPYAHYCQVEPVKGKEASYHGYPVDQARHRHVGDHPEGRLVAGVAPSHEHHHQKVRHGGIDEEAYRTAYGGQDYVCDEMPEA